eukprot:Skav213432  [mRNA]  locus=scaffold4325:70643:76326:+ [translate_table: standard]
MADFDPTDYDGQNADDPLNDGEDELGKGPQDIVQLKDAVLFVIDCSTPNALKPLKTGGRCIVSDAWLPWIHVHLNSQYSISSTKKAHDFHAKFIDLLKDKPPKDGNAAQCYAYIASMDEARVVVAEACEPVKGERKNRFFRKCGHESFLQVRMKMCPRFRLPERLKPVEFLGRMWEFLGPLKISRKKGQAASDKRHSFMFVNYQEGQRLSASSIRRSHIRGPLALPGRDSTERNCEKHFFCRWLAESCPAESCPEKVPSPEEELLRKRKYSARFSMGWTDAIPTCCFVEKCLEVGIVGGCFACWYPAVGGKVAREAF